MSETQSTKREGEFYTFTSFMSMSVGIDKFTEKYGFAPNAIKANADNFALPANVNGIEVERTDSIPVGKFWLGYTPENATQAASAPEAAADKPVKAAKPVKLSEAQIDVLKAYRDNTFHNRSTRVTGALLDKGLLEVKPLSRDLQISDAGRAALAIVAPEPVEVYRCGAERHTPLSVADEFARLNFAEPREVDWTFMHGDSLDFALMNGVATYTVSYRPGEPLVSRAVYVVTRTDKPVAKPASKGAVAPSLVAPTENVVDLAKLSASAEIVIPTITVERFGLEYTVSWITPKCIAVQVGETRTQCASDKALAKFFELEAFEWARRQFTRDAEAIGAAVWNKYVHNEL